MMIICSLVKIITIHTHTHKRQKKTPDIANTNNYFNVLTQYVHYIPYVYTILDYIDIYIIYH